MEKSGIRITLFEPKHLRSLFPMNLPIMKKRKELLFSMFKPFHIRLNTWTTIIPHQFLAILNSCRMQITKIRPQSIKNIPTKSKFSIHWFIMGDWPFYGNLIPLLLFYSKAFTALMFWFWFFMLVLGGLQVSTGNLIVLDTPSLEIYFKIWLVLMITLRLY